jgi:flagellar hook-basal body complex protein FliE
MSDLNIANVLSQIRSLREQAAGMQPITPPVSGATSTAAIGGSKMPAFGDVLKGALDQVSISQGAAAKLQEGFQLGDPRADLPSVMLAMQKSQVSFRALVEVRNRVVQAYQDVMNMPI